MPESPVPTPAETPAETIRRAAERMRQLANAATGGEWYASTEDEEEFAVESDVAAVACYFNMADAEHVASWQPTVALAVADWLDFIARAYPNITDPHPDGNVAKALNIARAYLGEVS